MPMVMLKLIMSLDGMGIAGTTWEQHRLMALDFIHYVYTRDPFTLQLGRDMLPMMEFIAGTLCPGPGRCFRSLNWEPTILLSGWRVTMTIYMWEVLVAWGSPGEIMYVSLVGDHRVIMSKYRVSWIPYVKAIHPLHYQPTSMDI